MKKLLPVLLTIMIVHVKGALYQIVDTENKIVCYITASNDDLYGSTPKTMSCVAITQEPVPAQDKK